MFFEKWSVRAKSCLLGITTLVGLVGSSAVAGDWNTPRPPGGRQIQGRGLLWPPVPRPVGKEARLIDQYHYSHYWPHPHTCEDRNSILAVMNMQASNGWIEGTTLFNYHFDPKTNELNSAGVAHLEYILFRVPSQHRAAFIQISNSAQIDQQRVAHVQSTAGSLLQDGSLPPIALRRARAYGTNAQEVDMISRKYIAGTPTPRLNGNAGSSSGAGATGAGGGSADE